MSHLRGQQKRKRIKCFEKRANKLPSQVSHSMKISMSIFSPVWGKNLSRAQKADLSNCRGIRHWSPLQWHFPHLGEVNWLVFKTISHLICSLGPLGRSWGRQRSHSGRKMQNRKSLIQLWVLNLKKGLEGAGGQRSVRHWLTFTAVTGEHWEPLLQELHELSFAIHCCKAGALWKVTPRQETFDIFGLRCQEEDELTLAWAGAWSGGCPKWTKKKKMLHVDGAFKVKKKRGLVAGAV